MLIKTKFGEFELLKNYREAFDQEMFEVRYVNETYDKFNYLVGDVIAEKLRIKGFSENKKSVHYFERIPDYLNESCNYNCPYLF